MVACNKMQRYVIIRRISDQRKDDDGLSTLECWYFSAEHELLVKPETLKHFLSVR